MLRVRCAAASALSCWPCRLGLWRRGRRCGRRGGQGRRVLPDGARNQRLPAERALEGQSLSYFLVHPADHSLTSACLCVCLQATRKEALNDFDIDVSVTIKGTHVPTGRKVPDSERKLYLLIEGSSSMDVSRAKAELVRILEEAALEAKPDNLYSKYSVV